ncbi:MAG TPA: hypothetical protein VIW94_07135 [Acidimicrobiia bacterium]
MRHGRHYATAILAMGLLWVVGYGLGATSTAFAHTIIAPTWSDEANVQWKLDSTRGANLAGATASTSYKSGDDAWNALSGSTLRFKFHSEVNLADKDLTTNPCGGTPPDASIEIFVYGGTQSTLGVTWRCVGIIHLERAYVGLRSASTWYVGAGSPGAGQYDLRSTITHEFGHAGGLNIDFSGTSLCDNDNNPPYHTMCGTALISNTWKRSLETHDIHSMEGFY